MRHFEISRWTGSKITHAASFINYSTFMLFILRSPFILLILKLINDDPTFSSLSLKTIAAPYNGVAVIGEYFTSTRRIKEGDFERCSKKCQNGKVLYWMDMSKNRIVDRICFLFLWQVERIFLHEKFNY